MSKVARWNFLRVIRVFLTTAATIVPVVAEDRHHHRRLLRQVDTKNDHTNDDIGHLNQLEVLQRPRALQEEETSPAAMELISKNTEENTITVRLRQVLFGSTDKCGEDASIPEDVALTMFAIYNNAEASGRPYCGFYYQTDACFSDDIVVSCDAETKEATVELLIRDLYHLDRLQDRTINPDVQHFNGGTCVGPIGTVGNAVTTIMTFDCSDEVDPNELNRGGSCGGNEDCPSDQVCMDDPNPFSGTGSFCFDADLPVDPNVDNYFGPCESDDECPRYQYCAEDPDPLNGPSGSICFDSGSERLS